MPTILVVDDDAHIRQLIQLYLTNEKFTVIEANDGEEALDVMAQSPVDLAIIDVMMPKVDGVELTKEIKRYDAIPILMVTAKGESEDKVKGFNAGTDDYLVKPFDPIELVLRVKALLKRYNVMTDKQNTIKDVTIDLERLIVQNEEITLELKRKECELLFELSKEPGRVFTRAQLVDKIWGFDYEGDERTVDVHIKRLREKLIPFDSIQITTVRGLGYRMEAVD
ncbi:DNA-binding response regulator, OmpR family, contains REC and winged-helix (wHTH) domain [Pelagirhabdus alkalitolerans]|uniref:Heme response regulator HssR n=1 Tax=Pelagirhabdus alkalitolerans TaxID=1612202 RepID=A0A1G6MS51_9BACI|nr:response regulator transcription factor [Pelagirhabdus alkalitolerans]SDC58044.1 DNA-binding response regulator, OmpR family, contains REC and winged-helix (wHTH) domain [Pelagirhabdus alkalitolerans]